MTDIVNNWTRDLRYKPYSEWDIDYKNALSKSVENSKWRTGYHIEPKTGLLNDPNGFSFFNGKWQLFFQYYPFGAVHGLKSWYHLESKDLIHWEENGIALQSDNNYDSHGVYSGSAYPIDEDKLFLFYTGNVRDKDWNRYSFQNGAFMYKDGTIHKFPKPLINQPNETTDHFRDPQIFCYQDQLYMIIGAQKQSDKKGAIFLYKALENDIKNWTLVSELAFSDQELGFMIECPNLIFIEEVPVLLFCPQGLSKKIQSYENIYPNMYTVGEAFDPVKAAITKTTNLQNLDEGFDVYATQAFNAPDGRALAISWIGLPEINYPTDKEGYQGLLSLVKELTLQDGKLKQYPVKETIKLREIENSFYESFDAKTNRFELEVSVPANEIVKILLFSNVDKTRYLAFTLDSVNGKVSVDREYAGQRFAQEYGFQREAYVSKNTEIKVNIFADTSVFECFVNEGERVITGRVFPDESQTFIYLHSKRNLSGTIWRLNNQKR
ncbi:sucrose-6-phosphate hydrolase [Niallia sp. FSL K6-0212]|uniref:sucrose-6-phosphate hydrolase n=1 Tax=Niallia sp. FSL K6-0212 TaxID=2921423 RepID=UPI0011AAB359